MTGIEAATLPMNGLTARMALDLLELPAGATVAVTGAAGAVKLHLTDEDVRSLEEPYVTRMPTYF